MITPGTLLRLVWANLTLKSAPIDAVSTNLLYRWPIDTVVLVVAAYDDGYDDAWTWYCLLALDGYAWALLNRVNELTFFEVLA